MWNSCVRAIAQGCTPHIITQRRAAQHMHACSRTWGTRSPSSTTSATSLAASTPPPIAMPTSACTRAQGGGRHGRGVGEWKGRQKWMACKTPKAAKQQGYGRGSSGAPAPVPQRRLRHRPPSPPAAPAAAAAGPAPPCPQASRRHTHSAAGQQDSERRQPQYFCGSKHVTAAAKSYGGQHTSGAMPTAAAMAWAVAAWSPDSITALMPILCSAGCNRNATGEAVGRSFIQRADAAAAQVWLACLKHCSREQALLPTGAGKSLTLSC